MVRGGAMNEDFLHQTTPPIEKKILPIYKKNVCNTLLGVALGLGGRWLDIDQ